MGIHIPIYRKNKEVIIFAPMSVSELRSKFLCVKEYVNKKKNGCKKIGNFFETVCLGATKEYVCCVKLEPAESENGYSIKASSIRKKDEEETVVKERLLKPDDKIEEIAMSFFNDTYGYEQGTQEQSEFFSELAEASTKFKNVIEFLFEKDEKKYFDVARLTYDIALSGKAPKKFYYIGGYGVTPDNRFSSIEYVKAEVKKDKFICMRKKLDLVIDDNLEQHFSFESFNDFIKFLSTM